MENKKTKLSISGNPKKSFKKFESSKIKGKMKIWKFSDEKIGVQKMRNFKF